MSMYSKLEQEFSKPMAGIGMDFKNEYTSTLHSFDGMEITPDEKYNAIRMILSEVLAQGLRSYSESKPKTKKGAILRWLAGIGSSIVGTLHFLSLDAFKKKP